MDSYYISSDQSFNIVDNSHRIVVILKTDGSVEFGPGITPDEAARQFWDLLAYANPLRAQILELIAENEHLRAKVKAKEGEGKDG